MLAMIFEGFVHFFTAAFNPIPPLHSSNFLAEVLKLI